MDRIDPCEGSDSGSTPGVPAKDDLDERFKLALEKVLKKYEKAWRKLADS